MSALWATDSRATRGRTESYAATLYERHNAAVRRHCLKQLRRREDADDAVQTTFVYALLSLRRGVVPRTELAWLFTIAGNVCSSNRRAWMRRAPLEAAQDVDALQDVIPTPERDAPVSADDFRSALRAMPEPQRSALLLREWRGMSYVEIADELGLSESATETLLFRARRTLARRLEEKTGLGTINGVSLASLLRSLLQGGAGKTLAVALGATAIAATPAAEHRVAHASSQAAGSTRPSLSVRPRLAAKPRPAARVAGVPIHRADLPPVAIDTDAAVSAVPVIHGPGTATSPPPAASAEKPAPSPLDVVSTITATTSSAVPAIEVPPMPPVVDVVPPLPNVQVPSANIPLPAPSLPTG